MKIDEAVERANFEAFIKDTFLWPDLAINAKDPNHYEQKTTAYAWLAWLARAKAMPERDRSVTKAEALEALDSLDDYARMSVGVNAIGPRGVLERYIANMPERDGEAVTCTVCDGTGLTEPHGDYQQKTCWWCKGTRIDPKDVAAKTSAPVRDGAVESLRAIEGKLEKWLSDPASRTVNAIFSIKLDVRDLIAASPDADVAIDK